LIKTHFAWVSTLEEAAYYLFIRITLKRIYLTEKFMFNPALQ